VRRQEPRRTPAIRRTPGGKWQARYRDPTGRQRSKNFARKTDAEAFLAAVKTEVRQGEWTNPTLRRTSFSRVAEMWLPSIADLEQTTRAQREQDLRVRLLPRLGARPVGSITDFDVRQLKADLLSSGLAPSTVTKCMVTLSQVLRAAVLNGYIPRNPCESVKKPGDKPVEETVFLTADQLNALADATEPRYRPMVLLAGYRGFRFGELAGLRTSRVKLGRATVEVVEALKEVRGKLYFGPPKHGRRRMIALPPFLVESVSEHMKAFPPHADLVFTGPGGALLRRSNFARRVFHPAVERAGVNEGLTFHGLRHTAVSILIANGASIVELAALMGWAQSTAAAMAVRYGHLFQARERQLTEAVEGTYRAARANESQEGSVTPLLRDADASAD
jgi:integrase